MNTDINIDNNIANNGININTHEKSNIRNIQAIKINEFKAILPSNSNINLIVIDQYKINNFKLIIKIIILFLLLITIIVAELFYREPLFNYTLENVPIAQKKASKSLINFFKLMSHLGGFIGNSIIMLVTVLFFPINKSFTFIMTSSFAIYVTNLFKIIYGNPRPYWEKYSIKSFDCDGGFGNPSGHNLLSICNYFGIWFLVNFYTRIKNYKYIIIFKIISFLVIMLFLSLIGYSRYILGAHSINQIIYGLFLGAIICYFTYFILQLQNLKSEIFFTKFISKYINIAFITIYILMIIIILILYFSISRNELVWLDNVYYKCPDIKEKPSKFGIKAGLEESLNFIYILSSHISLIVIKYLYDNKSKLLFNNNNITLEEVNNYNNLKILKRIIYIIFFVIVVGVWFILSAISSKSNLTIIIVFKSILRFFGIGISVYLIIPIITIKYISNFNI